MTPINEIPAVCNYGTSAVYSDYPNDEQLRKGVIPLDSLPAAWWNKMWCATNCAINEARDMVGQLITEINSVLAQAGVCPAAACTDQLYQSINLIRQRLATASVPGSVLSSNEASKVAIAADGTMSVNCLGNAASLTTSASTIVGAINELKSTYDTCFSDTTTAIGGKAPTSHASSATTYGVGSASNYGHLKISDTYASVLAACSGVAASQKAIACVYAVAAAAAEGNVALGNTAGCALGTASAGTAITAARSDHVHPKPSRADLGLGTAADCAATDFRASTWTPSCVSCASKVRRNAYTNAYLFTVALTNGCSTADGTDLYASCKCLLTFCNTTGVLYANTFCGSLRGTATKAGYATCLYNRPGSTEASKVCNVMFYAGCSNASCAATNYAACICGSNGWMYGLAGIVLPYIRAVDPGSAASKVCNVQISAYCTNAQCLKTVFSWTFCGCTGYMRGNVCGNVCGDVYGTATNSCKVYKTMATDNANRQVLLGEASEGSGCGCVYVGNACKLMFNTGTGVLCTNCIHVKGWDVNYDPHAFDATCAACYFAHPSCLYPITAFNGMVPMNCAPELTVGSLVCSFGTYCTCTLDLTNACFADTIFGVGPFAPTCNHMLDSFCMANYNVNTMNSLSGYGVLGVFFQYTASGRGRATIRNCTSRDMCAGYIRTGEHSMTICNFARGCSVSMPVYSALEQVGIVIGLLCTSTCIHCVCPAEAICFGRTCHR